jgi:hypothetical protein
MGGFNRVPRIATSEEAIASLTQRIEQDVPARLH